MALLSLGRKLEVTMRSCGRGRFGLTGSPPENLGVTALGFFNCIIFAMFADALIKNSQDIFQAGLLVAL